MAAPRARRLSRETRRKFRDVPQDAEQEDAEPEQRVDVEQPPPAKPAKADKPKRSGKVKP